jgi:hypothetical protein
MNIVEPILFHCKTQAAVAAMCAPGHALPLVSYGRLGQFIVKIAGHARAQGLGPGNLVALRIEEPILHAAFILGLAYLGAETVSVRDDNLPAELGIDAVIADKPRVFKNARRVILADMNWLGGDGRPASAVAAGRWRLSSCDLRHHRPSDRLATLLIGDGSRAGAGRSARSPCSRIFIDRAQHRHRLSVLALYLGRGTPPSFAAPMPSKPCRRSSATCNAWWLVSGWQVAGCAARPRSRHRWMSCNRSAGSCGRCRAGARASA